MPALILFKRRWKVASDDLVIPAAILSIIHLIWTAVCIYILVVAHIQAVDSKHWISLLKSFIIGLAAIFSTSAVLEVAVATVSGRGGPLRSGARSGLSVLLYLRLGLLGIELFWEILNTVWLLLSDRPSTMVMCIFYGFLLFNWHVTFTVICRFGKAPPLNDNLKCQGLIIPSCSFHPDVSMTTAGRTSVAGGDGSGIYSSINDALYKGGIMTNSLVSQNPVNGVGDNIADDKRFYGPHDVCCFSVPSKRNSFGQLESVLSFMMSDLDLVQSDIVAGLVLLKRTQRSIQDATIAEPSNEVYQFLSGTPITSTTRFLGFKSQGSVEFYSRVVRFMRYPLATHKLVKSKIFKKFKRSKRRDDDDDMTRCACCQSFRIKNSKRIQTLQSEAIEKELANLIGRKHFELLHCSILNPDLDGLSFLVGLDHEFRAVVVCLWSATCLKDAFVRMCSIRATNQCVMVRPDWFVSEHFALLAEVIYTKLRNNNILLQALSREQTSNTECYELIITGQSIAGGVACVLAVLLRQFYHNLHCFAYAPPNCIFNATCVRETQSFITTVVVGKDMVPRLSCHQIESFRQNLISSLKSSTTPKLKILCTRRPSTCCSQHQPPSQQAGYLGREGELFSKSSGLYLPGKVIHIVRSRPKTSCSNRISQCKRHSVFQAVWARNEDFKNILVSRKMISDHSPFLIMDALEKVLTHISPAKPMRKGVGTRRGHQRPMISANSSHNETTLTSQNTVSDFSTSDQLIESTYAPATLSMAPPPEISHQSVQEFFSQSFALAGNFPEPQFELDDQNPYERVNNQTFPKVKLRSSRPSEFANRAIRIMPQQISPDGRPQQSTEGFYNTINVPNHFSTLNNSDHLPPTTTTTTTTTSNAANHFLTSEQNNKRQPILIDNWTGAFAPLASPEALSESSSLASCGESSSSSYPVGFVVGLPGHRGDSIKRLSSGAAYQRLVARIDPIRQSPLGPVHPFSGGFGEGVGGGGDVMGSHKDLPERIKKSGLSSKSATSSLRSRSTNQEAGSVKEEELTKDLREFGAFVSHDAKESYYAEIDELVVNQLQTPPTQEVLSIHKAGPKSDSLYDLIFDTSPTEKPTNDKTFDSKEDPDLMMFSPPSSGEHLKTKPATTEACSSADDILPIFQQGQQTAGQFEAVSTATKPDHEPIYSKVIPKTDRKLEGSEVASVGGLSSPVTSDFSEADVLERISTESNDDDYEQGQVIYDLVIGHYSCAGRGYPHGFIESYSKVAANGVARFSIAEEVSDPPNDIF